MTGSQPGTAASVVIGPAAMDVWSETTRNFRQAVQDAVPSTALSWSSARSPTVTSLEVFRPLVVAYHEEILSSLKPQTALERSAGDRLALRTSALPSVAELADFFNKECLPSSLAESSRVGYDGSWRSWVTFAVAHRCVAKAFPADDQFLRAFGSHLVFCGYRSGTIGKILSAIVTRHFHYGAAPVFRYKELSKWLEGLKKRDGAPLRIILPKFKLRPEHIHSFLSLPPSTLRQERDVVMTAVGTVGAMRQDEVSSVDLCDWVMHFMEPPLVAALGSGLYVRRQKNDQHAKGMFKRFAFGSHPSTCIPSRVEAWMERANLRVHPACAKWSSAAARAQPCTLCGKLFPSFSGERLRSPLAANGNKMSKQAIGVAISALLQQVGVPVVGFSSKSMRKGGLSAAKRAGIPADLRRAQSGHKSTAHTVYESESDTDDEQCPLDLKVRPRGGWTVSQLYHFSRSFGL